MSELASQHTHWAIHGEDSSRLLGQFLRRVKANILGVVGDLDPDLFGAKGIGSLLERGVKVEIVFSQEGSSLDKVVKLIEEDRPQVATLARRFPDTLRLHWIGETPPPPLHFLVADSKNTMNEAPNHPKGKAPPILVIYEDLIWSKKWLGLYRLELDSSKLATFDN